MGSHTLTFAQREMVLESLLADRTAYIFLRKDKELPSSTRTRVSISGKPSPGISNGRVRQGYLTSGAFRVKTDGLRPLREQTDPSLTSLDAHAESSIVRVEEGRRVHEAGGTIVWERKGGFRP